MRSYSSFFWPNSGPNVAERIPTTTGWDARVVRRTYGVSRGFVPIVVVSRLWRRGLPSRSSDKRATTGDKHLETNLPRTHGWHPRGTAQDSEGRQPRTPVPWYLDLSRSYADPPTASCGHRNVAIAMAELFVLRWSKESSQDSPLSIVSKGLGLRWSSRRWSGALPRAATTSFTAATNFSESQMRSALRASLRGHDQSLAVSHDPLEHRRRDVHDRRRGRGHRVLRADPRPGAARRRRIRRIGRQALGSRWRRRGRSLVCAQLPDGRMAAGWRRDRTRGARCQHRTCVTAIDGVTTAEPIGGEGPVPRMFSIADPDGNHIWGLQAATSDDGSTAGRYWPWPRLPARRVGAPAGSVESKSAPRRAGLTTRTGPGGGSSCGSGRSIGTGRRGSMLIATALRCRDCVSRGG